jgi:hypothetical protein
MSGEWFAGNVHNTHQSLLAIAARPGRYGGEQYPMSDDLQ